MRNQGDIEAEAKINLEFYDSCLENLQDFVSDAFKATLDPDEGRDENNPAFEQWGGRRRLLGVLNMVAIVEEGIVINSDIHDEELSDLVLRMAGLEDEV